MGMPPSSSRLIRSASLGGYADLMRSLGHDPSTLLRTAGLSARLLDNPETRIPIHSVRVLLETAARTTGVEDFALRLAARRSFSDLGPISLVLKDEPTARAALFTLAGSPEAEAMLVLTPLDGRRRKPVLKFADGRRCRGRLRDGALVFKVPADASLMLSW